MMLNLPEVLKQGTFRANRFKPIKGGSQSERWYQAKLLALVKEMRKGVEEALTANSSLMFDSAVNDKGVTAFNIDRFLSVVKRYQNTNIEAMAEKTASEFTARVNKQNANELTENLKRQTGLDLRQYLANDGKVADKVGQLTQANVALIKSIQSQYLDKVQLAVTQAQIKGELNAELAKKIKEIGGTTENRAKLIARDQSSKINAALTRVRHEELGITKYRWSTSGDERVRDSHAELDGQIFSYDNPPSVGNPGDDYNCRCIAIPVFDGVNDQQKPSESKDEDILFIEKSIGTAEFNTANEQLVKSSNFIAKYKLSPKEALSIIGYTGNFYKKLNHALRSDNVPHEYTRYEKLLNSSLDKLPSFNGVTYRAIRKLSKEALKRYEVGSIVTESFFVSTSELKQVKGFSGRVKFNIYGKNGRKIEELSLYPYEKEVLFKSNSRFIVKKVSQTGFIWKKTEITLQEIE